MKALIVIAIITVLIALYVVAIRPWLRTKEWAQGYIRMVEPIELALWNKSESILWARFLVLLGALPGILSMIAGVDLTPFLAIVPEKYRPWLFMAVSLSGVMAEMLRRDTTKPLSVVALPEKKPPEVAAAIERAEIAKEDAVATIEAAAKAV